MIKLEWALQDDGYIVWNETYPSREKPIEQLSPVVGEAMEYCRARQARPIHFVTHSLGGILVRHYFQNNAVAEAKRAVMLAPPNRGSEVSDHYRDEWWYRLITGPAGQQLGTEEGDMPRLLKPILLEIGIIAGSDSSDPWFDSLFKGDSDGKVSVRSTKLPEMRDFLLIESSHTFIMNSDEVITQIIAFLRAGSFSRSSKDKKAEGGRLD